MPSLSNSFVGMALASDPNLRPIVDLILEESPIFGMLPTIKATSDTQNKGLKLQEVVGGGVISAMIDAYNSAKETVIECGEAIVDMAGAIENEPEDSTTLAP